MSKTRAYVDAVERGEWPAEIKVPLDDAFIDERGEILNLIYARTEAIARIVSKKRSLRANHVHRTDWHFTFVEKGHLWYLQRKAGDVGPPHSCDVESGEMFFTPPGYEHAMIFDMDSVIYTFARNRRTHENHEEDLTRVELVNPYQLDAILDGKWVKW